RVGELVPHGQVGGQSVAQHHPGPALAVDAAIEGRSVGVDFHGKSRRKDVHTAACSSIAANKISPASRLDLNSIRQCAGSLMSSRVTCQARCAAKADTPMRKMKP